MMYGEKFTIEQEKMLLDETAPVADRASAVQNLRFESLRQGVDLIAENHRHALVVRELTRHPWAYLRGEALKTMLLRPGAPDEHWFNSCSEWVAKDPDSWVRRTLCVGLGEAACLYGRRQQVMRTMAGLVRSDPKDSVAIQAYIVILDLLDRRRQLPRPLVRVFPGVDSDALDRSVIDMNVLDRIE